MVLGFIGTGHMGGALAKAASVNRNNALLLANRHPEKAQKLADMIGGSVCSNFQAVSEADLLFIGVKPQMLEEMLSEIREQLSLRKPPFTVVSMVAGRTIAQMQEKMGCNAPVIRIMPNTPVAVGEGIILYTCSSEVTEAMEQRFLEAMSNAGRFLKIEERLADVSSVVGGCGPAFAAMFLEALSDGGVACGMPRDQAMEVSAQMMLGTAKLMLESHAHPGVMKDAVCSPGGSTIQGVRTLEERAFRASIIDAVIASYEKTLRF